jgi:hypothetical protein
MFENKEKQHNYSGLLRNEKDMSKQVEARRGRT